MTNASLDSIRRVAIFSAFVLAVFVLYIGRELLIPLALAILISFLLTPVVKRLQRWHVSKPLAVLLATGATAALMASDGYHPSPALYALTAERLSQFIAGLLAAPSPA